MPPLPGRRKPLLSPFKQHCEKWKDGCGAEECSRAVKRVFCRGTIPCDVLFMGEAPGASENVIGQPFVGPAGQLLDRIVLKAIGGVFFCTECRKSNFHTALLDAGDGRTTCINGHLDNPGAQIRWAFTNLVSCMPTDEDGAKAGAPTDDQVESCKGRLVEFVRIASPRLLVCVGKEARDWTDPQYRHRVRFHREIPRVDILHPAAILRQPIVNQGLSEQRCVVTISQAVEEYLG